MGKEHRNSARYGYIDALRGLAVLGVVVVHVANSMMIPSDNLNALLSSGARGVQLFYIVSSFTIIMSLASRGNQDQVSWTQFYIRRFFRIAPMFYLAVVYYLFTDGVTSSYWAPDGLEWWAVPLNFTFLHGWHPETINSLVPGGWSIAVEVTFYLLVPLIFFWVNSISRVLIFVFLVLAFMSVANEVLPRFLISVLDYEKDKQYLATHFFSFWFFSQLPVFAIGVLCYYVAARVTTHDRFVSLACLAIFVVIFLLFSLEIIQSSYIPPHIGCSIAFVFLLLGLKIHPWKIIVNRLATTLGKISFSVYIVHFAVIKKTVYIMVPVLQNFGLMGLFAYFCIVMLATVIISSITYKLIEKPFILIGKNFFKRRVCGEKIVNFRRKFRHI